MVWSMGLASSAGSTLASSGNQTSSVITGLVIGFVVLDIIVITICVLAVRGRNPPRN